MADVKASEIVGELRKGERFYEVFREASKVASFFADLELKEATLLKSIKDLEEESKRVDAEIEKRVAQFEQRFKESQARAISVENDAKQVKIMSDETLVRAKNEAFAIIANAKKEAELVKANTAKLRQEEKEALEKLSAAKTALDAIQSEMKAKKEQLLKAFN